MNTGDKVRWVGYAVTLATLVFGFMLFYSNTQELVGSLFAAFLSAALVLVSFIMFSWLIQVFTK